MQEKRPASYREGSMGAKKEGREPHPPSCERWSPRPLRLIFLESLCPPKSLPTDIPHSSMSFLIFCHSHLPFPFRPIKCLIR